MKYQYGEFNGQEFISPNDLFASNKLVDFILQYGQEALEAMEQFGEADEQQQIVVAMIQAGLLEREEGTGKLRMTPKMLRSLEHRALLEIFEGLRRGSREGHPTRDPGRGDERTDGTKAYQFGDPVSEIDLLSTLRNALRRHNRDAPGEAALPLCLGGEDLELFITEGQADVATCVLLDMSGSMMRWGRFYHAKRVAMGLSALVRQRFPQDTIDFIGFHSLADRLRPADLPLVMPKPVSLYDHVVRLRVPLEQAQANPQRIPQHFTNLHLGLRLARQTLARRGAANKQIFIITDGQPTAHIEVGAGGTEMLYLLYPPSQSTADATLKEAMRCRQAGIRFASFALVEDYWAMDWVGFVDQLTRLTRGMAFYCSGSDLSSTVIESFLSGRRRKSFIA